MTYPFPWPPGKEPTDDPRVTDIADAARDLVAKRDAWLNPPGASEAEVKKRPQAVRTLTNLYNIGIREDCKVESTHLTVHTSLAPVGTSCQRTKWCLRAGR